jgi:BirA family transcriptional regulator, biotin operon repressor / biotin---[acetyl-CoA-carboxylase] ligase
MFNICKFDIVDSTNDVAKDHPIGDVIVAKEQRKGKGRFGREWISGKGGLWVSLIVEPKRRLFEYTFIASLAVLNNIGEGEIKWPNDILVDRKKLCGILSEGIFQGNATKKIIIGVGVNVNNKIDEKIKELAISLKDKKGKQIKLEKLLEDILKKFIEIDKLGSEEILKMYKENCGTIGKNIRVKTINGTVIGKAVDIDEEGRLLLKTEKEIIRLEEGDISII